MSNTSTLIRKRCIGGLLAYRVRNGSHEKLLILGLSAFFSLNCLGFMSQVPRGLLIAMAVLCHIESSKRKPNQELDLDGGCIYLFGGKRTGPPSRRCAPEQRSSRRGRFGGIGPLLCASCFAARYSRRCDRGDGDAKQAALRAALREARITQPAGACANLIPAGDLWEGLTRYIPRRLVDTGSTAFPYIYVSALYGLWRRRKERVVWALALCFLGLVLGYTVETVDSDSPIGERY